MTVGRTISKRIALSAIAVLVTAAGLEQAQAQYYRDEGYGRPDRYERSYDEEDRYERRPPPPRRYGYEGRQPIGSVCVTARGNCPAYPGPLQTPCRCDIPGFGPKRGAILQ